MTDSPTELREEPLEGEIWRRRGSMKGVKEEEDLCFCSVLLADCVCNTGEHRCLQGPSASLVNI